MSDLISICKACHFGDIAYVRSYIRDRKPEELNKFAYNHRSMAQGPIHYAVESGHLEIVRLLLEAGADPNLRMASIKTAMYGDFKCKLVIHETPLFVAVMDNHHDIVKLLLDFGADPNLVSKNNSTPLHAACFNGNLEIVKLLLGCHSKADIKSQNELGFSALHYAAGEGHIEVVRFLLEMEPDLLLIPDKMGLSAAHLAEEKNQKEVVNFLKRRAT